MMKLWKKGLIFVMIFSFVFFSIAPPQKAQAVEKSEDYVEQLISYYKNYQEAAATDFERVLSEFKASDEKQGNAWEKIINFWRNCNKEGFVNVGKVPENLPNDDSVAIVILGFALNPDGTMKDELIGRLETGLNIAKAYPNSYVVVTGGGTAANNPNVTEGGLMGEWLLKQGLPQERLIVENRAPDTVGNAKYTYEILKEKYPQVKSVVLVTSDYHVPRGCLLYYSKFVLEALKTGGEPLEIISNSGYETGSQGYESISLQANGLCSVAGISSSGLPKVELSKLENLNFKLLKPHVAGETLQFQATATYDTGYQRDVSQLVNITGFDSSKDDTQKIHISYQENGTTLQGTMMLSQMEMEYNNYLDRLSKLVEKADGLEAAIYVKETYDNVQYASAHAKEILNDVSANQQDILECITLLEKAFGALKQKENIALNKTVEVSHNSNEANFIVDGSKETYWASYENGNIPIEDTEVVIDLQGIYDLESVNVVPFYSRNDRYYFYDVYASEDKTNWEKIGSQRDPSITTEKGAYFNLDTSNRTRYIKIVGVDVHVDGRDDINNFHICEILAYGKQLEEIQENKVENLALHSRVDVDSGDNSYYLTNGNTSNQYWGSTNGIHNASVVIELPNTALVEEIKVITYYNNMSKWYTYDVLVSDDQINWTPVGEYTKQENAGKAGSSFKLDTPINARYVKVQGTDTNNTNLHLVEIEVYGSYANIALNKNVETNYLRSSDENYAASNVTDGKLNTMWDTGNVGDWNNMEVEKQPWVIIDLENQYSLDTINVLTYVNHSRYYHYEVYVSKDGKEYRKVGEKVTDDSADFSNTFQTEGMQARYLKVQGTYNSANPGFHLYEVRATGTPMENELANYQAVVDAKSKVPSDLSIYTFASVMELKFALANVQEGLPISRQDEVDAMAQAINDAIDALEKKPVDKDESTND